MSKLILFTWVSVKGKYLLSSQIDEIKMHTVTLNSSETKLTKHSRSGLNVEQLLSKIWHGSHLPVFFKNYTVDLVYLFIIVNIFV